MSRENLTPQELKLLATQDGAFAVIMGYLKSERGKIAPSVFNKITQKLGYPKQSLNDLVILAKIIKEDELLGNLYNKGYERVITLEDIPNALEGESNLTESELFKQVTSYIVDNEDNNARLREHRKLQREGAYMDNLIRHLKKSLAEELKGMPRAKYLKTPTAKPKKGNKSLILLLADWHIGALVYNKDTGGYNFKKFTGQMQEVIEKTLELIEDLHISNLYIFHLGDAIEHISMRNVNQAFESEFPATHQISKATRVIVDILLQLSKNIHVTFGMVAGNHDRFDGNKNDKVYNDNAVYLILDDLFFLQEKFGQLPNVTLIDNREDTYEFTVKVAGKTIKVKHGDHESKKTDVKIPNHIKTEPIDYLIMGHIHTSRIVQEDYHRFHVYVGSTMGANNYSKELNLPTTNASQMIMVLTEGSNTPWFIPVMFDKEGKIN